MSSEEHSGTQQDGALADSDPEVSGWWLFLVAGGQAVGVIMVIKLLAHSFDLPFDTLLYLPAVLTLSLVTGTADPRTFHHLVLLSAVSVTAALVTFVTTLVAFLIFSPNYLTVVVIVVSGLLSGLALLVAPAVHRRFGIPLRTGPFKRPDQLPPERKRIRT